MPEVTKIAATTQIARLTRVAAYARVSCGKDAMLHSLSAQIEQYSRMIQSHHGWQYTGVYADEAITGTKEGREEFQRLLDDCRAGKIDMVITKSVSRFARNTVIMLSTVRELKAIGVDVYFEKENIHSISADGELMLTILASFAQEESRSVSENCKWTIRKRFAKGESPYFRCYGYTWKGGKLYIQPEEAKVVTQIFKDYLGGMGIGTIVKKLNAAKIPSRYGTPWIPYSIYYMLRNERYVGDLLLQKKFVPDHIEKKRVKNRGELPQYYVTDAHEPIISRETFAAVQEEIARRKQQCGEITFGRVYPFSRKMVCGQCGAHYRRKLNAAGTKYEKPVWICAKYNTKGKAACASKQIPENILMQAAAAAMGTEAFDPELFSETIDKIQVTGPNSLCFHFKDGTAFDAEWQDHSRRDSWTPDMREQAAKNAKKGHDKRCQQ